MHVWVVRQARKILNFGKVVLQPSRQYYSSQPAVKITITHHFFMLFYIWHNINVSQTIFYWYFMYLRIIVKFCKIYLINSFKLSFFFFFTLYFTFLDLGMRGWFRCRVQNCWIFCFQIRLFFKNYSPVVLLLASVALYRHGKGIDYLIKV